MSGNLRVEVVTTWSDPTTITTPNEDGVTASVVDTEVETEVATTYNERNEVVRILTTTTSYTTTRTVSMVLEEELDNDGYPFVNLEPGLVHWYNNQRDDDDELDGDNDGNPFPGP